MLLKLILTSILLVPVVFTQDYPTPRAGDIGDCSLPTDNDPILGNHEAFSNQGLLPSLFAGGDGTPPPFLLIVRSRVTCLNTGFTSRFTASSVSFIVEYRRQTAPSVTVRAQVSVDCIPDPHNPAQNFSFYPTPPGSDPRTASVSFGFILRDNTDVPYNTTLRVDCSECSEVQGARGDQAARCRTCAPECNFGSRRCVGFTQQSGQCCPYFLEDRCVLSCPSPLIPNDVTFVCDCGTLTIPTNGEVSYSAAQRVGSVANYTCNEGAGYVLPQGTPNQRTCSLSGWSGSNPMCQLHDCNETTLTSPPYGDYMLEGATTFGAHVTYKCADQYSLVGETTVRNCTLQGWSGSTPRCEISNITIDTTSSEISTTILATSVVIALVIGMILASVLGVLLMVVHKVRATKRSKSTTNANNTEDTKKLCEELTENPKNESCIEMTEGPVGPGPGYQDQTDEDKGKAKNNRALRQT